MSAWLAFVGAVAVGNLLLAFFNFGRSKTELAIWQLNAALWMLLYVAERAK